MSDSYQDVNTPVVQQITLPSGNTYYIADRQLRNMVPGWNENWADYAKLRNAVSTTDTTAIELGNGTSIVPHEGRLQILEQAVAGGVAFIIAWNGSSTPVVANIPSGISVTYGGQTYTGTLSPETTGTGTHAQPGAFYLVYSATQTGAPDTYDEYVPVGATGSKQWQKIGDTQINLTDVVTDVTMSTVQVIGNSATLSSTQPTIAMTTADSSATGRVQVVTNVGNATASGGTFNAITALGTASSVAAWTGASASVTDPSITLTANNSSSTGRITYVQGVGAASTNKIKAVASGAAVSSTDTINVISSLGSASTSAAVSSVASTSKKLATTTVTGVSGSTTASKASTTTASTVGAGTWTAATTADANVNQKLLASVSVSNGVLTIGAADLDTKTVPQYTFSDVTVPKAANSATTVATGSTTSSGSGADIVTNVNIGSTFGAVTGYASPSTTSVLKGDASFTVTQPTITLSTTSSGDVTVVTGIAASTTKYLSASASGTSVTPSSTSAVVTGYANPTTSVALGTGTTISVASTSKYLGATASGASVGWNSKDTKTVASSITVTKGTS